MNSVKSLYESIASLADIQAQLTATDDGESTALEFKAAISDKKKMQSLVAKETCAFLNSNDGLICVGIENDNGTLKISNTYSGSLEDLIDKNIANLFEPNPSGILTKTIAAGRDNFVVIYVPFSNIAPHRVAANKSLEGDVQKNYYTRMMSNSVPMPEHLVKAMYLSNGRLPNLEAYPTITKLSANHIEIQHLIRPDRFKFIKKDEYYTEMKAVLFDGNFNIMSTEDGIVIDIENSFSSALHPSNDDYLINTHAISRIQDEEPEENSSSAGMGSLFATMPRIQVPSFDISKVNMNNDESELDSDIFDAIYAIFVQTSIACESMSLKTNYTLFYLTESWHQKNVRLVDSVEFVKWGESKGVQILIPVDVDRTKMPLNGIDECINKIVKEDE